jgi:hypothetical protein
VVSGFGDVFQSLIQTGFQTASCTPSLTCIAGYPSSWVGIQQKIIEYNTIGIRKEIP